MTRYFRAFYEKRAEQGLPIETYGAAINRVGEMSDFEVTRLMLTMPFEKFERKFFLEHRKDLNKVAFVPSLWKRLRDEEREELLQICERQLQEYFNKRIK